MYNKIVWLLLIIFLLMVTKGLYYFSTEEVRASIIFFGSITVVCLVAGLIIALGIKSFLINE